MNELTTSLRLGQPAADELYAELIEAMRQMDEDEALRFSARLVLLLINHVGDPELVRQAIRLARTPRDQAGGGPGR
jgi:hypothetical protein